MNIPYTSVRQNIVVLPADAPINSIGIHDWNIINAHGKFLHKSRRLILGWTMKENIGVGVANIKGIKKFTLINKSRK